MQLSKKAFIAHMHVLFQITLHTPFGHRRAMYITLGQWAKVFYLKYHKG